MTFDDAQESRQKLHANAANLAGRRFGKLLVISASEMRKNGKVVWRCQCDCGGEKNCTAQLLNGKRSYLEPSCGCNRFTTAKKMKCMACGLGFYSKLRRNRGGHGKACSLVCAVKIRAVSGEKNPRWNPARGRSCIKCGTAFRAYTDRAKFCSKACYDLAKNLGKSKASKLERMQRPSVIWRLAVIARDKHVCQICKATDVKLHADHIKPWSLYPELRLDLSNGRALCVPCHKKTPTYGFRKMYMNLSSSPAKGAPRDLLLRPNKSTGLAVL